jgi:hypothetical protein
VAEYSMFVMLDRGMNDTGMGVCAEMHVVEYSGTGLQKHGMQ